MEAPISSLIEVKGVNVLYSKLTLIPHYCFFILIYSLSLW